MSINDNELSSLANTDSGEDNININEALPSHFDEEIISLKREIEFLKERYINAVQEIRRLEFVESKYNCVTSSTFWKITTPFRFILDVIKKACKKFPPIRFVGRFLKSLKRHGLKGTILKIRNERRHRKNAKRAYLTKDEYQRQADFVFEKDIKFSILVPLYNTPKKFLCEMIDSVVGQTYKNWELCLADGSDKKHDYVREICEEYSANDPRIVYKKLEKNLGISENTNACIDLATGDYITLFDHDDILHQSALFYTMEAICNEGADFIYTDETTFTKSIKKSYSPHFKPDFSPDTLRGYNYICHLVSFKAELLEGAGRFRKEFDGSQDFDMILRLTENAKKIVHIPRILYFWRCHSRSVASDISAKPYTVVAAKKALNEHLKRVGLRGTVVDSSVPSTYKIDYNIINNPLISIIIANKDNIEDLDKCIKSIKSLSTYKNHEIIVVENNSVENETFAYYDKITQKYQNVRVVYWQGIGFNYSSINNFGVAHAQGDYVLLLNNDIEIISPCWLEEMLMFAQRSDVGAVGAMLYYPDNTIQHAGVIIGIGADRERAVAGHSHKYFKRGDTGYSSRLVVAQNLSAVTAACIMSRKSVFTEVEGLDERYAVAFNDVDYCLKVRSAGYLIVWTPFAEAYHYESKSRGAETSPEKIARFNGEIDLFLSKWKDLRDAGDPYYNQNLTLEREDFSLR